jgi:arylsulfatase A-like enzyme
MFFGLYPSEHQYYNYKQRVSDQWVAIAELLKNKAGYKTYGLSTNPHVSKRNGLAQGFDVFISPKGWSKAPAGTVNERFKTWAGDIEQDRFFAMLWYTDTHVPYNPPESIKRKFLAPEDWNHLGKNTTSPTTYDSNRKQQEVGKKLYFASVSYFDREFGKLIAFLEEAQLLKNTAIILTSDHGEALGDHKIGSERAVFGHCSSLRAPQVEIPLIIYLPWLDRQVEVTTPAQSIDLYPTLRDLARITSGPDYPLAGRSLLPSISRQTEDPERLLFTELITTAYTPINKRGVRRGDFGLVYTYIRGKKTYNPPRVTEVFFGDKDTLSDAQKPDHDALKADLSKQYQAWTEQVERTRFPSEKAEFKSTRDRKTLEKQLRALGYVQ